MDAKTEDSMGFCHLDIGFILAFMREKLKLLYSVNEGTDQPGHLPCLICNFVVHSVERKIAKPATCKTSYSS